LFAGVAQVMEGRAMDLWPGLKKPLMDVGFVSGIAVQRPFDAVELTQSPSRNPLHWLSRLRNPTGTHVSDDIAPADDYGPYL